MIWSYKSMAHCHARGGGGGGGAVYCSAREGNIILPHSQGNNTRGQQGITLPEGAVLPSSRGCTVLPCSKGGIVWLDLGGGVAWQEG